MARTDSTMVPLGTPAPDFSLPEVSTNEVVSLDDFADAAVLVVMFICKHCPYVVHVQDELAAMCQDYDRTTVAFVGISANDAEVYPDDAPAELAAQKRDVGFTFPYLYDQTQAVARAYGAACTPDFFVFDAQRQLAYRGQMDGSRPRSQEPVTGAALRAAIDLVAAGQPVPEPHLPSMGCNIKWRE